MRVCLAVQLLSNTMTKLIEVAQNDDFVDPSGKSFPGRDGLESMLELTRRWNDCTDIMNCAKDKGRNPMSHALDPQLIELIDLLGFHTRWRSQYSQQKQEHEHCIPSATEKCIARMIMGAVSFVCHQTRDPVAGRMVVLRRCQQDCCVSAAFPHHPWYIICSLVPWHDTPR